LALFDASNDVATKVAVEHVEQVLVLATQDVVTGLEDRVRRSSSRRSVFRYCANVLIRQGNSPASPWSLLTSFLGVSQSQTDTDGHLGGSGELSLRDLVKVVLTTRADPGVQHGSGARFPTRHHYATYNGTAPIDASSGSRKRHRLNPRGNRMLNHATHLIAIAQLRYTDTAGRVFYQRKLAEGKTRKEAIRALKRRLSDVVYRHLVADQQNS
jgi:hypothetical protein